MKHQHKLCLALVLALPLAACGENKAADSMKDATSAASAKLDEAKASFVKMTETSINEITKSIEDLKAKSANAAAEKKPELDAMTKNITAKKDEVAKMFADIKSSAGNGFESMKDKLTTAIADLNKMIADAMAKLK